MLVACENNSKALGTGTPAPTGSKPASRHQTTRARIPWSQYRQMRRMLSQTPWAHSRNSSTLGRLPPGGKGLRSLQKLGVSCRLQTQAWWLSMAETSVACPPHLESQAWYLLHFRGQTACPLLYARFSKLVSSQSPDLCQSWAPRPLTQSPVLNPVF